MTFDGKDSDGPTSNQNRVTFCPESISKSQPDLEKSPKQVWMQRLQGSEQRGQSFHSPLRRSKTAEVTTSSIGVGTSPSLEHRKPIVPSRSTPFVETYE